MHKNILNELWNTVYTLKPLVKMKNKASKIKCPHNKAEKVLLKCTANKYEHVHVHKANNVHTQPTSAMECCVLQWTC